MYQNKNACLELQRDSEPQSTADVTAGDAQSADTQTVVSDDAEDMNPPQDTETNATNVNWYLVIGQIILINGLMIGGGFFAYKRWWRSDKSGNLSLLDEDSLSDGDQPLASILNETKT